MKNPLKAGALLIPLAVVATLLFAFCAATAQDDPRRPQVYVIPISGDIDPGMAAFLKRALSGIPDTPASLIVVKMDTFGGRVDAALEMVDALLAVKQGTTIAYVAKKAISAGALISLACNKLVMQPNTTIGDCAPITYSNEGPKMMGEKFQSPLRAKFRTLARRNGYPAVLAESMVTVDMEVYRVRLDGRELYMDAVEYEELDKAAKDRITERKTIVAEGELLTMDDSEALELGFSAMSVDSIDQMLDRMGLTAAGTTLIEATWSEAFVSLIGKISPILMLIGLGALYTEIKAPGFGLPGIVGIVCLGLVFFNQYLVGLADHTELLLLAAGIVLLGFEVFVLPGFGIAGIAGIICITAALLLGFQDFVIPDPKLPWEKDLMTDNLIRVLGSMLGAFLAALFFLRYIMPPLSKTVKGPYLAASLAGARLDLPKAAAPPVGKTGIAMTALRPAGKASIEDEVYDVVTQGDFIERGTPVRILKIIGVKIIVARIDSNA